MVTYDLHRQVMYRRTRTLVEMQLSVKNALARGKQVPFPLLQPMNLSEREVKAFGRLHLAPYFPIELHLERHRHRESKVSSLNHDINPFPSPFRMSALLLASIKRSSHSATCKTSISVLPLALATMLEGASS
jgi:hypothetical protein